MLETRVLYLIILQFSFIFFDTGFFDITWRWRDRFSDPIEFFQSIRLDSLQKPFFFFFPRVLKNRMAYTKDQKYIHKHFFLSIDSRHRKRWEVPTAIRNIKNLFRKKKCTAKKIKTKNKNEHRFFHQKCNITNTTRHNTQCTGSS